MFMLYNLITFGVPMLATPANNKYKLVLFLKLSWYENYASKLIVLS